MKAKPGYKNKMLVINMLTTFYKTVKYDIFKLNNDVDNVSQFVVINVLGKNL